MVPIMSILVPILVSAVIVFIVSSIIHMALPYHRSDFKKLASENEVMDALRQFDIPPGDYMIPCAGGPAAMKSPEFLEKRTKGPVAIMTFIRPGPPAMGVSLVQWFVFALVVGVLSAYITGRTLTVGAPYLEVFRLAGTTAFLGYSVALLHDSIWYKRSWSTTFKFVFDGLIYGLMTGGTFGWLWPR